MTFCFPVSNFASVLTVDGNSHSCLSIISISLSLLEVHFLILNHPSLKQYFSFWYSSKLPSSEFLTDAKSSTYKLHITSLTNCGSICSYFPIWLGTVAFSPNGELTSPKSNRQNLKVTKFGSSDSILSTHRNLKKIMLFWVNFSITKSLLKVSYHCNFVNSEANQYVKNHWSEWGTRVQTFINTDLTTYLRTCIIYLVSYSTEVNFSIEITINIRF